MLPQLLLAGCADGVVLPPVLARPNHLAVMPDGSAWVSDFQHDRLVHVAPDGAYLGEFGHNGLGPDALWRVTAMAADGPELLLANLRPESDASDAELLTELVRVADGREVSRVVLDGLALSADARVDGLVPLGDAPGGHLVLVDSANGELLEVDGGGQLVGRFGGLLPADAAPHMVARSGDELWLVEQKRHRITVVGRKGRLPPFQPGDEPLRFPSAVAVCPDFVAVADFGNRRVRRFARDGTPLDAFSPHPAGVDQPFQLLDLAASPACDRLWLVDSKGDRVLATDLHGTVLAEVHGW